MEKTNEIAHFDLIKQQNKKIIRNLLRHESSLSVPQITKLTGLTYPTCSSILKELLEDNQVIKESEPTSKGGRPGVNYRFNEGYKFGLIMYFADWNMSAVVCDCKGNHAQRFQWTTKKDIMVSNILDMIKEVKETYPNLTFAMIGVPGVVSDGEIVFLPKFSNLVKMDLKKQIQEKLQIEVSLENDLNAMAYAKVKPGMSYAMIAYVNHCVGTGIVLDGKIHTGSRGFAGELESLCTDITNQEHTISECVNILLRVLDLQYFYILGDTCSQTILDTVEENLQKEFKVQQVPQLFFEDDMNRCYEQGLLRKIMEEWEKTVY